MNNKNATNVHGPEFPPPGNIGPQHAQIPYGGAYPHYGATPYYHSAPAEEAGLIGSLDFMRLIRVLRRKWKSAAMVLLFCIGAAVFYLLVATRIYSASCLLEMSVRRPRIGGQQGAVIEDPTAGYQSEEVFNTRLEKMKSKSMAAAAFERFAAKNPEFVKGDLSKKVKKQFETEVDFSLLRRTRLIRIEFQHPDPVMAAEVCNTFAEAAEAGAFDENRVSSDSAVAWLQNQAALKRKELDKADDALMKLRQDNKIDVLQSQRKTIDDSMIIFNKALTEARAEQGALMARYTAKHPQVESSEKTIRTLQAEIDAQTKLASELELQILDRQTRQAAVARERDACELSYKGILNRIEEARLAADEHTATVKLAEKASVPEQPVKPRVLLVLVAGLMLGLLGGVGFVLVVDTLEDNVAGPQDIESIAGLKVLAVIPHVEEKERKDIATASLTQKLGQFAEIFAGLRTVMDSSQYKDASKVILVSSSAPGEGKTITTTNLAITCARNGQKVLLIDFDMRRPRIMNIFPIPAGNQGLLNMLVHDPAGTNFKDLVYDSQCPNLQVIGSRVISDVSPAEMIGGRQVSDLLVWARGKYDRVILDAPPLGLVSDATVLAGLADCVLIVSRAHVSRKRATAYIVQRFREIGVTTMGAVVNDVDFSEKGSYHSAIYSYSSYHS